MMRVTIVEPAEPVVSFKEAARHLRLDGDDERQHVEALIAAAQGHIDGPDGWLGRSIGLQTLELHAENWPATLPYRPAIEVLSAEVDGVPVDGIEVVAGSDLIIPPRTARPSKSLVIRYRAGYEEAPAPIKAAILLMLGDLYANRETTAERARTPIDMSTTVSRLLAPYRIWSL